MGHRPHSLCFKFRDAFNQPLAEHSLAQNVNFVVLPRRLKSGSVSNAQTLISGEELSDISLTVTAANSLTFLDFQGN